MIELPKVFKRVLKTAVFTVSALAVLAACSGDGATNQLNVHYVLAPVDGGSCVLLDASSKTIAGPVKTKAGTAALDVPAAVGMAQLSCAGGTYTDEATGTTAIGIPLRSYIDLGQNNHTAVVTPLTELVFRVLAERDPAGNYQRLSEAVAAAFGLAGIEIDRQVPDTLASSVLVNSQAARYGAMLAALSQLQLDGSAGAQTSAVIDNLAAALTPGARFNDAELLDGVTNALQNLMLNTRLQTQLAGPAVDVLIDIFDKMQQQKVASKIWYVDTDNSSTQSGEPGSTVEAGAASSIEIVGLNLDIGLGLTLGGARCELHDLQPLAEVHVHSHAQLMIADCPPQASGTVELVVTDHGDVAWNSTITVVEAGSVTMAPTAIQRLAATPRSGTGSANVKGKVTADAPWISVGEKYLTGTKPGSLRYDSFRTFPVRGVVVELLEIGPKEVLLMTTSTDADGLYRFTGAASGKTVMVRVKAQLLQVRDPGKTTGSEWSISVRDNTSNTSEATKALPKRLYTLESGPLTTVDGEQEVNLRATLGFDNQGNEKPVKDEVRQSAPFSILEVVYNAAIKLQAIDSNIKLPELNIYWSVANTTSKGLATLTEEKNKQKGDIDTSHYQKAGTLPGLFILGKANTDTDEFDQGVIGHEFGHYLQDVLSYSDSPGDDHRKQEFKDPSLTFGEGYGTAIGALLANTKYYTDSSWTRQSWGSMTDLSMASAASVRKGFYSEESVGHVMYTLGKDDQFARLWRAVSALRNELHSATIFAFLNQFIKQNPTVDIAELRKQENIRSTDPFGALPAGSPPDPAIGQDKSGAPDLETQYLTVPLIAGAPKADPELVSTNSPAFCLTHTLSRFSDPENPQTKPLENTLGMSRRFTFKSTYTGWMVLQPQNKNSYHFNTQKYYVEVREEAGKSVDLWNITFEGQGIFNGIKVVEGRVYSVKLVVRDPLMVFGGSTCGNRMQLLRMAVNEKS